MVRAGHLGIDANELHVDPMPPSVRRQADAGDYTNFVRSVATPEIDHVTLLLQSDVAATGVLISIGEASQA
jgi:hypothetical protein